MTDPEDAAAKTSPILVDLYKTAVEMADRVSARRGLANTFFLSLQTTFTAVVGLTPTILHASWPVATIVMLVGVTLSATWWLQLRSYRDLNRAKFAVINAMEADLPVKIFTSEWGELAQRRRYAELGFSERLVPAVFAALHVALFATRRM